MPTTTYTHNYDQQTFKNYTQPFTQVKSDGTETSLPGTTVSTQAKVFNLQNNNIIYYYTGTQWKECEVYYYDASITSGSKWVQCIPYYYDNNKWNECE